uniref:Uncharacterized protein n=1 Tax=Arundo donax TaxID=35708 RepID=A0A0A8YNG4_ARUDO
MNWDRKQQYPCVEGTTFRAYELISTKLSQLTWLLGL